LIEVVNQVFKVVDFFLLLLLQISAQNNSKPSFHLGNRDQKGSDLEKLGFA
jgi:hypothetical protein